MPTSPGKTLVSGKPPVWWGWEEKSSNFFSSISFEHGSLPELFVPQLKMLFTCLSNNSCWDGELTGVQVRSDTFLGGFI